MPTDVSPERQNIDVVFTHTNYKIDFYQREYKWKEEEVRTLLNDIFHVFEPKYDKHKNRDPSEETVHKFNWYYLSTYVINSVDGNTYVVDGQQRLTTLTLMLISLHNLAERWNLKAAQSLQSRIMGFDPGGNEKFWLGDGKREDLLRKIYNKKFDDIDTEEDITATNMVENFDAISSYLKRKLDNDHKLKMFIYYLLLRVVMVRLDVQSRTDVPMVFEIINDRGVSLKPHEILKGKLLSKIDKEEVDPYNAIWEDEIGSLEYNEEADEFFETYLGSRFAKTRDEAHKFNDYYHRRIFESPYDDNLQLRKTKSVKDFINNELPYYVSLYRRLNRLTDSFNESFPHVYYNYLTQMDSQFLLTLAVCDRNDPYKDKKIREISKQIDRLFVLLQLNNSYDSNLFADSIYGIRTKLKGKDISDYSTVFNHSLFKQIQQIRDIQIDEPLPYRFFREIGYENLNRRFLRYFFMRIEEFISEGIGAKLPDDRYNLVRNSGSKNGYHIEHILAKNDENLQIFDNNEEEFQRQRHRIGALLILNNRTNISSGNDTFEQKKEAYASTLYWNQSLREDFVTNKPNTREFLNENNLNLAVTGTFDENAIEKRTKALYQIAKEIWNLGSERTA